MYWYWIDRFTVFDSGKHAQSIKGITRSEDHLHNHFPYHPVMPMSLMIEGLAQTGGLLIGEVSQFETKVVLGKIPKIQFYETEIIPGDTLYYDAFIEYIREDGSMAAVTVHRNGTLIAEGSLVFAHLNLGPFAGKSLFKDGDMHAMLRDFGAYDIGKAADGSPLKDPVAG